MAGQPASAIDRGEQVMSVEQAKAIAAQIESAAANASRKNAVTTIEEDVEEIADGDGERETPNAIRAARRAAGDEPQTRGGRRAAAPGADAGQRTRATSTRGRAIAADMASGAGRRYDGSERRERRGWRHAGEPSEAGSRRAQAASRRRTATASAAAADGAADAATAADREGNGAPLRGNGERSPRSEFHGATEPTTTRAAARCRSRAPVNRTHEPHSRRA